MASIPYMGDKTYGQIEKLMREHYPELADFDIRRIHTKWRRLGKLAKQPASLLKND